MSDLGFAAETRSFRPHITLARIRRDTGVPSAMKDYLKKNAETGYGKSRFSSIILYESQLTKTGPIYTKIAEKKLGTEIS